MELHNGQQVVLIGVGVVRVESTKDPICLLAQGGNRYELHPNLVSSKLRALSSVEQAKRTIACFGNAVPRIEEKLRAKTYRRAHKTGDLLEMAETLTFIYSKSEYNSLDFRYWTALETSVFEELAAVLDCGYMVLKRAAQRAVANWSDDCPRYFSAPDRNEILAKSSELMNENGLASTWTAWSTIYVEDEISMGPYAHGLTLKAEPGTWFIYARSEEDERSRVLAIQQRFVKGVSDFSSEMQGEKLLIERGHIAISDAWFAKDPDVQRELGGRDSVGSRFVNFVLRQEGPARLFTRESNGRTVQVEIELPTQFGRIVAPTPSGRTNVDVATDPTIVEHRRSLLSGMREYMKCANVSYNDSHISKCNGILSHFLTATHDAHDRVSWLRIVRKTIKALNKLASASGDLIETDQREDICLMIERTGTLRGFVVAGEDVTEMWREW